MGGVVALEAVELGRIDPHVPGPFDRRDQPEADHLPQGLDRYTEPASRLLGEQERHIDGRASWIIVHAASVNHTPDK